MLRIKKNNLVPGVVYIVTVVLFLENYSYLNLPDFFVALVEFGLILVCIFGLFLQRRIPMFPFLIVIGLLVCLSINAMITGDNILLNIVLVLLSANAKYEPKKILKIVRNIMITYATLLFICSKLGLVYDRLIVNSLTGAIRHSYGFTHTNRYGAVLMIAALIHYYIKYESMNNKDVILPLYTTIMCTIAQSRTSMYISLLVLIASVYRCFSKRKFMINRKAYLNFLLSLIIAIISFNYISVLLYNDSNYIWKTLNQILSQRLRLAQGFIDSYPITIFGQNVKFVYGEESIETKQAYATIDSLYIYLLLKWGVVITGFIFALYAKYIRSIKKRLATEEMFILLCIVLFSFSENQLLEVGLNFTFFILAKELWLSFSGVTKGVRV